MIYDLDVAERALHQAIAALETVRAQLSGVSESVVKQAGESAPAPEGEREVPTRDDRLLCRVANEVRDAAGLRPDDPPLREHLDAAREIIRLVRCAPASQGERERLAELRRRAEHNADDPEDSEEFWDGYMMALDDLIAALGRTPEPRGEG